MVKHSKALKHIKAAYGASSSEANPLTASALQKAKAMGFAKGKEGIIQDILNASAPANATLAGAVGITNSIESAPSPVKQTAEEATPPVVETPVEPEPTPEESPAEANGLSASDVAAMIAQAIASVNDSHKQELEAIREQERQAAEAKQQALTRELEEAKQSVSRLSDVFKLMGRTTPVDHQEVKPVNVNTLTTVGSSDRYPGAIKEFYSIYDNAPKMSKFARSGRSYNARDNRELNRFVRENRNAVIRDLEKYAQANGFLRGTRSQTQDFTTSSDILGGFLPVLSALMRTNNRPGFIFWQFADTRIDFAQGLGDTVKIPRAPFLPGPATSDERLLSGNGVFYRTDPGNQNLSTGVVDAVIQEWGLGKDSTCSPVGIPTFVRAYSMIDLMGILERNLLQDYWIWEDKKIRELWDPTSRVVYNNRGEVTTSVGDVTTGDGGQLTQDFLASLYGYMRELQVPTYMDGCYGYAAPTRHVTQLKKDLAEDFSTSTEAQIEEVTNIFNLSRGGEMDRVTGYVGKIDNFHIFETNAYGVGAAGTEGVQTETINSTSVVTRSAYAFGANTIGRGIGTEMEIRTDNDTDFDRMQRFIWREESGFVAMDVDPLGYSDSSAVPQQLRVLDVRMTDVAI